MKSSVRGLVSIGLPAYNRPDSLQKVLQQILAQSYQNFEVLIIDDASPDEKVMQVAKSFTELDKRFQYFRNPENHGVLKNAALVLARAQGEYFSIFSDDDWHAPDFLTELIILLEENHSAEMAFSDYNETYADGRVALGYPKSHIPIFLPFTRSWRFQRIAQYYWQDSMNGKQNLFYSVFRRSTLSSLNFQSLSENFSILFMDSLIVYKMIQKAPVLICPKLMCTLTVGNQKFYQQPSIVGNQGSGYQKILSFIGEHRFDRQQFIKNTDRLTEKITIFILYPFKICFLLFKILIRGR